MQYSAMKFLLSGFDQEDSDRQSWAGEKYYDSFDSALDAAKARMLEVPAGRVEVIQVQGGSGNVIVSVSTAGIEKITPVIEENSSAELKDFVTASATNSATHSIVRTWRSTAIQTTHSFPAFIALLDTYFGTSLRWKEKNSSTTHRRFTYTRGKMTRSKGIPAYFGTRATGRLSAGPTDSSVTLRYRPSRAVILAGAFAAMFLVSLSVTLATWKGKENPLPEAALGFIFFGAPLVVLAKVVVTYRREIDAEFIAACSGAKPKKRKTQQRQ
jgi:hypothetical protein